MNAIDGLTVNGTRGVQLWIEDGWVHLDGPPGQVALQGATINRVAYERRGYPVFLWVAGFCLVMLLTAIQEMGYPYWYWLDEQLTWPVWALGALVAAALYALTQHAAVVIASGTTRTALRGPVDMMDRVFTALLSL